MTLKSIETAVYALLSKSAAVAAVVSDRIYYVERPQESAAPALEYVVRRVNSRLALDGDTGLTECEALISFVTPAQDDLPVMRYAIAALSDGYRGTSDGVSIQSISFAEEEPLIDEELRLYVDGYILSITYEEP